MKKKIAVIMASIIAVVFSILAAGNIILRFQVKNEIKGLFASSKNISHEVFTYDRLKGLPKPVQAYFKHVLKEGQPFISYARLRHDGQFKTGMDRDWVDIEGEEYFTAGSPGFVWIGRIPYVTARDMYLHGRGRLVVSLLSLIKIVDGTGENFDQGELLRWLTECVWMPTALLPNENLKWSPVNSESALLSFTHKGMKLFCIVYFNDRHEITRFVTKRYMIEKMETWSGLCGNYKEVMGVKIPARIEAVWNLKSGDFSYARFRVEEIEFNQPVQY